VRASDRLVVTTNLTIIRFDTPGRAWIVVESNVLVTALIWISADTAAHGRLGLLIRRFREGDLGHTQGREELLAEYLAGVGRDALFGSMASFPHQILCWAQTSSAKGKDRCARGGRQ